MAIGSSQHPGARLVRCTEHSLAYDPAVATGCALCRRSVTPDDGRRSVTRSLLLGLAALVAASAGYFVFRSNRAPISSVATMADIAERISLLLGLAAEARQVAPVGLRRRTKQGARALTTCLRQATRALCRC